MNGPKRLYVNPGCFKCISGKIYLLLIKTCSPLHSLYTLINLLDILKNKKGTNEEILFKGIFIPKLHNNPPPSCSLINFYF